MATSDPRVDGRGRAGVPPRSLAVSDAATAAVDARIAAGDLVEEAIDDHDVRKHYSDGAELVEDVARSKRHLPEEVVPVLERIDRPLVVRERCRARAARPWVDSDLRMLFSRYAVPFGRAHTATVTRRKVAGMEVASSFWLAFWPLKRASSSACSSASRPSAAAASKAFMVGP